MSRTSRRVSRPLIAGLAVVIVLGVVFTVHKVRKSHAQVAEKPTSPVASAIVPPSAPAVIVKQPEPSKAPEAPKPAPAAPVASTPTPTPAPADTVALVTETPTEKVSSSGASTPKSEPGPTDSNGETSAPDVTALTSPAPAPAPSATTPTPVGPATTDANPSANNDSAPIENDAASLQAWANGSAKTTGAGTGATSSSGAPVAHDGSALAAHPPAQVNLTPLSIADARTKLDAGDLISARQILNENLIAARGDADALKQQIEQINQTLIFSPKKFPDDPWGGSYQVAGGERLGSIASRNSVTWELLARINNVTPKKLRQGQWIKVVKGPFYAIVTKHTFKMDLYLGAPGGPGSMYVRTFMVGLGKDNSTPTGLWSCKPGDKIRNPRYYPSRGGDIVAPDDPKNPLGGYWIAIEGLDGQAVGKESYGIHGTIEPDSVGKMSSQGCIRLRAEDISWVFDLLVDGKSKVRVND